VFIIVHGCALYVTDSHVALTIEKETFQTTEIYKASPLYCRNFTI
jgi:hypothetical protein